MRLPGPASCVLADITVQCPVGYTAIGGGFTLGTLGDTVLMSRSDITGWHVVALNYDSTPSYTVAQAVCMDAVVS